MVSSKDIALMLARKRSFSNATPSSSMRVSFSSLVSIPEISEPSSSPTPSISTHSPNTTPSSNTDIVASIGRKPSTSISSNSNSTTSSSPSTGTDSSVSTTIVQAPDRVSITSSEEDLRAAATGRNIAESIFHQLESQPSSLQDYQSADLGDLANTFGREKSATFSTMVSPQTRSLMASPEGSMFGGTTVYDESRFASLRLAGAHLPGGGSESVVTSMHVSAASSDKDDTRCSTMAFPMPAYRPITPVIKAKISDLGLDEYYSQSVCNEKDLEAQRQSLAYEKELARTDYQHLKRREATYWMAYIGKRGLLIVGIVMLVLGVVGGWVYILRH